MENESETQVNTSFNQAISNFTECQVTANKIA